MPIDLNSWRAAIANINYGFMISEKRIKMKCLFGNMFLIVWMFSCIYFFVALCMITIALSFFITVSVTHFPYIGQIVAYLCFRDKSLFTDSYIFNFASLTIQIQKCLSKFFSKCVCFVVRDQLSVPYRLSYMRFITQGKILPTFFGSFVFSLFHYLY